MRAPLSACPRKLPNTVPENMYVEYTFRTGFGMIFLASVPPHEPVGPNAHLENRFVVVGVTGKSYPRISVEILGNL